MWKILDEARFHFLAGVDASTVLLEYVKASSGHPFHPRFDEVLHHFLVHIIGHTKSILKTWGGLTSPSLQMAPRTKKGTENFTGMIIGTSKG